MDDKDEPIINLRKELGQILPKYGDDVIWMVLASDNKNDKKTDAKQVK